MDSFTVIIVILVAIIAFLAYFAFRPLKNKARKPKKVEGEASNKSKQIRSSKGVDKGKWFLIATAIWGIHLVFFFLVIFWSIAIGDVSEYIIWLWPLASLCLVLLATGIATMGLGRK